MLAAYVSVAAVLIVGLALKTIDPSDKEAVLNPSAFSDVANWYAGSDDKEVSLSRVRITEGPRGVSTAVQVRRPGDGGAYPYVLASLETPEDLFEPGETYRMRAYVRDLGATGRSIGMLLANSNFRQRPTELQQHGRYTKDSWHLLQRTFVAREGAGSDTGLYSCSLPVAPCTGS